MRVVEIVKKTGNDNILQVTEREFVAALSPGQIILRIVAAAVNRTDILQRRGQYTPPSGVTDIPGVEVSGYIEAVGAGVTRFEPGDAVCAVLPGGGYAEYVIAEESLCHAVPKGLSMTEAAALPYALFAAWNAVFMRGRLRPGQTLLIHGGTSSVGMMATQMAHQCGSPVYVTTGTSEKKRQCLKLGARMAIDRSMEEYAPVMRRVVPEGIDVVLDMSGGDVLSRDMDIMAPDGRHISIAHMTGKSTSIDIPTLLRKRLTLAGTAVRDRPVNELAAIAADLDLKIWPMIANKRIVPVVDRTFPLEEVVEAHKHMESGRHMGKIVLKVSES